MSWAQTHPRTYDHLVTDRGWPPARVAEQVTESLIGELTRRRSAEAPA